MGKKVVANAVGDKHFHLSIYFPNVYLVILDPKENKLSQTTRIAQATLRSMQPICFFFFIYLFKK